MRYETVTPTEFVKRCRHLFEQNYTEAALLGHPFNLFEDFYSQAEESTPSFAIVAYDGGEVVGYCSVFIGMHQHTSVAMATNDAIFVLPEYRSGLLTGQLFVRSEREAKARGAVAFQWVVPVRSPLYKALLVRTPKDERLWCQVMFQRNFS